MGRFVNHSQTQANTALIPNGDNFDLIATRSIEPGEEMLADYVEANGLLSQVDTDPYDFHYDGYASPMRGYVQERFDNEEETDHHTQDAVHSPKARMHIISIRSIKTANPFAKQAMLERSEMEKSATDDITDEVDDPPTVAVDLDGTLAEYDGFKGEDIIGKPRPYAKRMMKMYERKGYVIIVHTCRGNEKRVGEWLKEHNMPYHHINKNPNQPPGTSDKLYANAYVDDRAVPADDLREAVKDVEKLMQKESADNAEQIIKRILNVSH